MIAFSILCSGMLRQKTICIAPHYVVPTDASQRFHESCFYQPNAVSSVDYNFSGLIITGCWCSI